MFYSKIKLGLALPLLVVCPALGLATLARADAPVVGVRGQTTGSQTFVRVRPSALTPPVAKVPSGTPLYVWGRFNDWYRVETHDHILGWVHKEYIRSPRLWKVKQISHFKAIQASEQSARQTLYGTPAELKAYYARYGGQGALKGLALKGIYFTPPVAAPLRFANATVAPKARSHGKTKTVRGARAPKPAPNTGEAPLLAIDPATREDSQDRLGANDAAQTLGRAPDSLAPAASSLAGAVRDWKPAPVYSLSVPPVAAHVPAPPAPVAVSVKAAPALPRIAMAPVTRAALVAVSVVVTPAKATSTPEQKHIQAWQARKHAKDQRWIWLHNQKVSAWKWRLAQEQKRAYAAQQRRLWIAKQHGIRVVAVSSRPDWKRRNVALQSGLVPKQLPLNVPGKTLAPISPDELLRARAKAMQGATSVGNASASSGTTPTPYQPSSLSSRDSSAPRALESGATTPLSMPVPLVVPAPMRLAAHPITVSANLAPSRGGSPRDRAASAWRSGVASQALSYRGMPYIFGAASPRRGFDCSGLVYFLLRQRGLNPPRTAAGYRTYGKPVARGAWQTGDLVLFANTYKSGISHIGVYLKDGKFVHAASTRQGIRVDSLLSGYFAAKYWGARRVR